MESISAPVVLKLVFAHGLRTGQGMTAKRDVYKLLLGLFNVYVGKY